MTITHAHKAWYMRAVRQALMEKHGLTGARADASIDAYRLSERLERCPEAQLHYDVENTADEIVERGL